VSSSADSDRSACGPQSACSHVLFFWTPAVSGDGTISRKARPDQGNKLKQVCRAALFYWEGLGGKEDSFAFANAATKRFRIARETGTVR